MKTPATFEPCNDERRRLITAGSLSVAATFCGSPALAATPVPPQLAALQSWLNRHLPSVAASLNPGAGEAQLDRLEKIIGQALPEDFRALYRWHNGQPWRAHPGPWYGLSFLALDQVIDNWRIHAENVERQVDEDLEMRLMSNKSAMPGVVKRVGFNNGWIPFSHDSGGNFLGIDLDPDVNGVRGQVINFGRDEIRKHAIAPSLTAFVQWMLGELNRGNYLIETRSDVGLVFHTRVPRTEHFLDSVQTMFPSMPEPVSAPEPRPQCTPPSASGEPA